MEQTKKPRRRLNILARTARTQRIFRRLREGWAYDEIAKEEHLSAERVRQIVAQVLERRVIDRREDRSHIQLERLRPALKLAGEAIAHGDLRAIGPLIRLVDRLDKHEGRIAKPFAYTESHRQRLLDKLNQMAENLADPETAGPLMSDMGAMQGLEPSARIWNGHFVEQAGREDEAVTDAAPASGSARDWFPRDLIREDVRDDGAT